MTAVSPLPSDALPPTAVDTAMISPLPDRTGPAPWAPGATRANVWFYGTLTCLLVLGAIIRIHLWTGFHGLGYDEGLYILYVNMTRHLGLTSYPDVVEKYIVQQFQMSEAILPPTRFLYIFCSYLWTVVFHTDAGHAVRAVSSAFSILTLLLTAAWSWRAGGRTVCLGVTALMTCAAVEIHLSQYGMIDGFFAFWALLTLWSLWECLQAPASNGWLVAYGCSLALMVLTKENAFFVYVALMSLVALNFKLRFGTVTRRLLMVSFLGPLVGVTVLLFLAGGLQNTVVVYRLLVARAYTLKFAIATGDGPWHRYLVDLLVTSPLTLLLALGAMFQVRRGDKFLLYLIGFVAVSYLFMCNVKYGMNLRYATTWDLPLRYLAFVQLAVWARHFPRSGHVLLVGAVALMCFYELRQYQIFFIENRLYELDSYELLYSVKIVK